MQRPSMFAKTYGPWALVSGASSGIGAEFVRQLAAEGLNIVLAARRKALLDEVGADVARRFRVETHTVVVDLSEEDAVERLGAAVGDLDIGLIVSNAGTGNPGHFLDQDHGEQLRLFRLNALSHLNIAHLFGRRLARRGGGGLLLGGAMGAAHGIPFFRKRRGCQGLRAEPRRVTARRAQRTGNSGDDAGRSANRYHDHREVRARSGDDADQAHEHDAMRLGKHCGRFAGSTP